MNRSISDLLWVSVGAVVAMLLVFIGVRNPLFGGFLALPLVFFLPGYAVQSAILHKKHLGLTERLALSLGLSLSLVVLTGLLLSLMPGGIQVEIWAALLTLITLAASLITLFLRQPRGEKHSLSTGTGEGFYSRESELPPQSTAAFRRPLITSTDLILFGLALLLVVGTLGFSRIPAPTNPAHGYTMLWLLPEETDEPDEIIVGLQSMELVETQYRLVLSAGGQPVQEWPVISLYPKEQWEIKLNLVVAGLTNFPIEAHLYRLDNPGQVYRHVILRSSSLEKRE